MKRHACVNRVSGDKAKRRRGPAIVAVAALMAGCSLQPVYERPAAPVADTILNKAAHGVGWTFGAFGESVDQVAGRLRRR